MLTSTMRNVIDIRTSHYFHLQFIALGVGLIIGFGLLIHQANYLLSPVFLLFGLMFLTTNNRLRIDIKRSTFQEYVWLLGFKIGKIKPLPTPTGVVINPSKTEIAFGNIDYGRMNSNQKNATGYLKFEDHESIYLGKAKSSKQLQTKLESLISTLQLPISDNSN